MDDTSSRDVDPLLFYQMDFVSNLEVVPISVRGRDGVI